MEKNTVPHVLNRRTHDASLCLRFGIEKPKIINLHVLFYTCRSDDRLMSPFKRYVFEVHDGFKSMHCSAHMCQCNKSVIGVQTHLPMCWNVVKWEKVCE